jgi:anti-anti-sigma factor
MSKTQQALYEWSTVGDVAVVRPLLREMTEPSVATELGIQLRALLDSGQLQMAIDLGPVKYMSSTAFGMLANLARRVADAGGTLKVFGMDPMVRVGADIIRLGELIPIYHTENEALSTF